MPNLVNLIFAGFVVLIAGGFDTLIQHQRAPRLIIRLVACVALGCWVLPFIAKQIPVDDPRIVPLELLSFVFLLATGAYVTNIIVADHKKGPSQIP